VSGLFDAEDAADPGYYFVGTGVGGFVEVDYAVSDTSEGAERVSERRWSEVRAEEERVRVVRLVFSEKEEMPRQRSSSELKQRSSRAQRANGEAKGPSAAVTEEVGMTK